MAAIAQVYKSILAKLRTDITNVSYIHKWNNQVDYLQDGKLELIPLPAMFVEMTAPTNYVPLGQGYSQSDLIVRIHILHEEYDTTEGTFEENFNVFEYRNDVNKCLNNFMPGFGAGCMMHVAENEDFVHTNLYHYTIEFICGFIDDTGSRDVQDKTATVNPPITIEIDTEIEVTIDGQTGPDLNRIIKIKNG